MMSFIFLLVGLLLLVVTVLAIRDRRALATMLSLIFATGFFALAYFANEFISDSEDKDRSTRTEIIRQGTP